MLQDDVSPDAAQRERDARARAERLQALTAALAETRTLDDVAGVVVADMVVALGARTGSLALRAPDGDELQIERFVGMPTDVAARLTRQQIVARAPGPECVRTTAPVWVESRDGPVGLHARYPGYAPSWIALGVHAGAFVPLVAGGETIGAISFTFVLPRTFAPEERAFLETLGRQAALAIERARLFDAERAARAAADAARLAAEGAERRVRFLAAASALLAESLDPEAVLGTVARLAIGSADEPGLADACVVTLATPEEAREGRWTTLIEGVDAAKVAIERERQRRYPASPDGPRGFPAVIRTGRSELVTPEMMEAQLRAAVALDNARLYDATRRSHEEAEAARSEAEAASRAKSEFLAVMSHELRTPLNAIGGYAELMELGIRGPVTEQQRADLARIQQSQRHLLGLIGQVLNYTRLNAGAVRYALVDTPVVDALCAAETFVVPQMRARGLAYVLGGCPPELDARVDREKLQQILLNLLSNAIKFTEAGGAVRVECAERAGEVAITVADTGIGIPPEKLESIFDPFVQADQRLTRPHEGVGLGLAISRELARGMGGDLTVESTPGVGSRFVLTLPRGER